MLTKVTVISRTTAEGVVFEHTSPHWGIKNLYRLAWKDWRKASGGNAATLGVEYPIEFDAETAQMLPK